MARYYEELDDRLTEFIRKQPVFFVATVGERESWVNLSPKGYQSLVVLDSKTVAYADYPGSGRATATHLGQDGRITLMFCSFEGDPLVLRVYGRGEVLPLSSDAGQRYMKAAGDSVLPWIRRVIFIKVVQVQTSCGYGVPIMRFERERPDFRNWCLRKEAEGNLGKYFY